MNFNSKWNPFGNYDDPKPLPELWTGRPEWQRQALWYFYRNPLHNFAYYWIGIVGKDFKSTGKYPNDVFAPEGWNWAWRGWLPFISYNGKIQFYAGVRERGNWGFALRRPN